MRYIELTETSRQTILQMYKNHSKKQVRERALSLLLSVAGQSIEAISTFLGKGYITVYRWFNRWEKRKLAGLLDKPGRGRKPILSSSEEAKAVEIVEKNPRQANLQLAAIEDELGKKFSPRTLKRVLRKRGYSWKRVRKWLGSFRNEEDFRQAQKELKRLMEQEDKGEIELYFCDESGFSLTPCVPYAWQKKGETICLPASKGKNYNVLGLMRRDFSLQAYGFYGAIDSSAAIACMDAFCLERKAKAKQEERVLKPACVIIDNAPIHNSGAFRDKEEDWKAMGVTIKRLPPYSPELNLIEILWRKVKYEWLPFSAYKSFECLVNELEEIIRAMGKKFIINFG